MIWMILDSLILVYETWVLFFLAKHFFSNQRKGVSRTLAYIILALLLHHIIAMLFAGHVALTALFSVLSDYILLGMLWSKQWRKRLFTIFFYYALMISLDLLLIFAIPVQADCPHLELYQLLCMIASRSLLLFVLLIAIKLGSKDTIPGNHFILVAPLPALISITLLISLYGYEVYDVVFNQQLSITVTIILLVVLVLLFAYTGLIRNEETLQDRLQAQVLLRKEQEKYCDGILKSYFMVRSTRHDLRHYIGAISMLIQAGQYEQALEICGSAEQRIGTALIYTGNETVDAILYSKQILFQQSEVTLGIEGCLPRKLDYDGADVCVILSNALENALEAVITSPVEERIVTARFLFDGWLLIIVENKIADLPAKYNGRFLSKKSGNEHGIGLDSISAACGRQNGYLETTIEDGTFILSATLQPNISQEK